MKDIHSQALRKLQISKRWIFWPINQKFYLTFFLIVLLISGQQNMAMAENEPNLSPEELRERLERRPETEKVFDSNLTRQEKINRIIQILDKESAEESLRRLDEIALYKRPGWISTMHMDEEVINSTQKMPLKASVGQKDVVVIMANRRFLKALHELSLLPKEKASDLVSREIIYSLSQYKTLLDSYMGKRAETFKHNLENHRDTRSLPGFVFTTADGVPTLMAVRYKVLTLLLLAGNLQLQQAQPAVSKALETAVQQRDMFYDKKRFCEGDALIMLYEGSLYNRQIVGTAVLGTYVDPNEVAQILKEHDCKFNSERLTRYNAECTPYEIRHVLEMVPVDYSKGELIVKYIAPLDDTKFDAIINAAKVKSH